MRAQMRKRRLPYNADAARRHLMRSDAVMRGIVKRVGPPDFAPRGRPYQSLIRALLYQQLAGAAAAAIERRFLALYGGKIPQPDQLLSTQPERLRAAGISRQKASYLYSLAEHFATGALNDRRLMRMPDGDVVDAVTRVKGVGRWTADMLLMFCLGRPDVLPVGDLGIQNAMRRAYDLEGKLDAPTMERVAQPWRPYRSVACWYLWRSTDVVTV